MNKLAAVRQANKRKLHAKAGKKVVRKMKKNPDFVPMTEAERAQRKRPQFLRYGGGRFLRNGGGRMFIVGRVIFDRQR